jgi:hypothetical protein
MQGSFSNIYIVHIKSDARVQHEMWVIDTNGGGLCGNLCWTEGGYTYRADEGREHYFYAAQTAAGGYIEPQILTQVYTSDYGGLLGITIEQDLSNSQFLVYLSTPSGVLSYVIGNPESPNDILIGEEISGSSVQAELASWNTNMWIQPQTYNAYFQNTPSPTNPGNSALIQNPPVSSQWYAYPSDPSTYGGTWGASCIC